MKVHVLLRKEELEQERLDGKVAVVLDILFATSTIVAALAEGAAAVLPCADGAGARAAASGYTDDACLLAGELNADTLPGFLHPTPGALIAAGPAGKTLIYATTNGTVALAAAQRARAVYAGALLNAAALTALLAARHADDTVLLVCAGSAGRVNLEDCYAAGLLVALLRQEAARRAAAVDFSDAALAVELMHVAHPPRDALRASRVGRMMIDRRLAHEVDFAAQVDRYAIVPRRDRDGLLRMIDSKETA